jgi:hypothetical protein
LHRDGLAGEVIRTCNAGAAVGFAAGESPEDLAGRVEPELSRLLDMPPGTPAKPDWAAFAPYTARAMTRRLCQVFDEAAQPQRWTKENAITAAAAPSHVTAER